MTWKSKQTDEAWLIVPEWADRLQPYAEALERWRSGEMQFRAYGNLTPRGGEEGLPVDEYGTYVVELHGVMLGEKIPRWLEQMVGAVSTLRVLDEVETALADPGVERVVLDVDSPGGQVGGVAELAEMIQGADKPVYAHVSGMAGSAAYYVASAAKEVTIDPQGSAGSIGAVIVFGRLKDDDWEELEVVSTQTPKKRLLGRVFDENAEVRAEARAEAQRLVDAVAEVFIEAVVAHRGDLGDAMLGQMEIGQAAVDVRLADRVSYLRREKAPRRKPKTREGMNMSSGTKTGSGNVATNEGSGATGTEGAAPGVDNRIAEICASDLSEKTKLAAIESGLTLVQARVFDAQQRDHDKRCAELEARIEALETGAKHVAGRAAHEASTSHPPAGKDTSEPQEPTYEDEAKALLALDADMNPQAGKGAVAPAGSGMM